METALFFAAKLIQVLLEVVSICMIARMLLPLFIEIEDNSLFGLVIVVTELFAAPVRMLLAKFDIGQDSPFDWGFFAAYLIVWVLQLFLPVI